MSSVQQNADAGKRDSARLVVRRLGGAFRAVRLYSRGHGFTQRAITNVLAATEAYHREHGVLQMTVLPEGIAYDFDPAPYEDELASEFVRALRGGLVQGLHLLPGVSAEEVQTLIDVLRMPLPALHEAGGAGVLLRQRGTQCIVIDDLLREPAGRHAPVDAADELVASALTGDSRRAAVLLEQGAAGSAAQVVRRLRDLDAQVVGLAPSDQRRAWQTAADAVRAMPPPLARDVMQMALLAREQAWAASLIAGWPLPGSSGGLAPPEPDRTLEPWPQANLPDYARDAALLELMEFSGRPLTGHAVHRLLELLPSLDTARFQDVLAMLEQQVASLSEHGPDLITLTALVAALSRLAAELPDGRAEVAQTSLHRMMSGPLRRVVERALEPPVPADHPVLKLLGAATDESVRLLLEMVADEDRRQVRLEIVTLLPALAAGRLSLLVDHLVDPRWYIARNVMTVLAGVGTPEVVPYLRAGLGHSDGRVRREGLQALGQLETPLADPVLIEGLRHADPETRALAARWLGLRRVSAAAPALAAILEREPLSESPRLKREVIRALGRIGTPQAESALQKVAAAGSLLRGDELEELRAAAAATLAELRKQGS